MELVSWLASHGSKARRGVIWGSTEIRASDSVDIVPPDQLQQFIHNIIRSHWTIGQHMTWTKQKAKEWTWNEVAFATTSPPDHNAMEHPRSVSSLVAFRNIIFEQEARARQGWTPSQDLAMFSGRSPGGLSSPRPPPSSSLSYFTGVYEVFSR